MQFSCFAGRICARLLVLALMALAMAGCGSDDHGDSLFSLARIPAQTEPDFSDITPFKASSSRSSVIKGCVTADTPEQSCSLEKLPLLGQETGGAVPTIEQVMDRVVVSHSWMGERFREVLPTLNPDILTLLKGVTAIVIDDDINRAFYYPVTGAIYIDPGYLWRTQAERATISRGNGGGGGRYPLSFIPMWRYTLNNARASADEDSFGAEGRPLNEIRYETAAVLYHELAHANDFFPPDRIDTLDPKLSAAQNTLNLGEQNAWVHQRLLTQSPWNAKLWPSLGPVIYRGAESTAAQRTVTAEQAGADFDIDASNDGYNYSIEPEDVSMLFEESMMKLRHELQRDIAFVPVPTKMDYTCSDLVVEWGYRDRIGDAQVKPRARFVVDTILPGAGLGARVSTFPAPTSLQNGKDWCSNLNPTGTAPSLLAVREYSRRQLQRDLSPPHER